MDDIDLYIGCLAEAAHPVNGSLLGPTGLCIVARQFADTKNNDRFFFDVGNQANSFTLCIIQPNIININNEVVIIII